MTAFCVHDLAGALQSQRDMRKPFLIPVLVGFLALGESPAFTQSAAAITSSMAPRWARTVVVPANVEWTNSGMRIRRGQPLRFEPSGEIRLSVDRDDVANAAGAKSGRTVPGAPIPSIYVGALIGRVNSGKPFSIGDTTQAVRMPSDGTLFLMVNDDHVSDNSGNLVVKIWEP
jgi:hypothetical protein